MTNSATPRRAFPTGSAAQIEALRMRAASSRGPRFWRSLAEYAGSPEVRQLIEREFLSAAPGEWPEGVSRRRLVELAGASMALAGLGACTRQPEETIVPYVRQPEEIVPGRPLYYATAAEQQGFGIGILVESHLGRPTKIEGNPLHPASLGATDLITQASILGLYDPDRARSVRRLGRIATWRAFDEELRPWLAEREANGGRGLRLLTRATTSPSLVAAIERFAARFPAARWHAWEPVTRDAVRAGAERAFGRPLHVRCDLTHADVVLAIDADLLASGPGHVRYARDFAARRSPELPGAVEMSRLYVVETAPTPTGSAADHRLALAPTEIVTFALALAAQFGIVAPPADADLPELARRWVPAIARDLRRAGPRALVAVGDYAPAELHVLGHALNAALGSLGATQICSEPLAAEPPNLTSIEELAVDLERGVVDGLFVLDGNPVYDAPADLDLGRHLPRVELTVQLSLFEDETSRFCRWQVPAKHDLERWGDLRAYDGTLSFVQPLVRPLYDGHSALELVALLAGDQLADHDLVRRHWQARATTDDFDLWFRRALHDGLVANTAVPHAAAAPRGDSVRAAAAALVKEAASARGLEVAFRPDPTIFDGRHANNGWLQETPKPITHLTWDNAALLGPTTAARLGVANGDLVDLMADGRATTAPTLVVPGHAEGVATLHLGYGRELAGRVAAGAGFDAYRMRTSGALWRLAGVTLEPRGGSYPLATTQEHHSVALQSEEARQRGLVKTVPLGDYLERRDFASSDHDEAPPPSLYPPWEYDGHAWGLTVDLSRCTGCNACVVACQAENNVPVVGKEQVLLGREMHWLRLDRYFAGPLEDPVIQHQPVLCMHCELAPCEVVCPVAATVHSPEGLNEMVYNRCVGTRYCSNNCPYKVRRFNFLHYSASSEPVLDLSRNPDVTVRARGVMEKCTYCVQRISAARIEAKRDGRSIPDGAIVTACQQACPSKAIEFGDVNDPRSAVSRRKANSRNYDLLGELGTRPRTSYLARVTNANPELDSTAPMPDGGGAEEAIEHG